MGRCINCLLPSCAPNAKINTNGICSWCRGDIVDPTFDRRPLIDDLESTLRSLKRTLHARTFDCLVPFSGGKDSIYLLHKLVVEYGLRVIALTVDINTPATAWSNINRTIAKLGLHHHIWKPPEPLIRRLFSFALANQEPRGAVYTASHVYAPIFESEAIRFASRHNIPLILAGYSPGQPEPERMLYEFPRCHIAQYDWTPPCLRSSSVIFNHEIELYWNGHNAKPETAIPRYLAPLHAWDYDQDQVCKHVYCNGYVAKQWHSSPILSNQDINWLMMYSDLINLGYNPYAPEFCSLIRKGLANKNYWRIAAPMVDTMILRRIALGRNVTKCLRWLGLNPNQLRISKQLGAYDPPFHSRQSIES